ncbi:right-handed parallel beta-helix repeat-containing protein [Streptomyces scabiei]|uniref:right-handed parallel beta-helix repeat-containing protein n=1 Tax=Streptomyces scabiei TaxID=1930 RepID=UPI0038F6DC57
MRHSRGRHRGARTLSAAAAVSVAAGAGGVYLGLAHDGARAATAVVTVSGTAALESAVAHAVAGTTIRVRGGTYRPARTLSSAADGTATARITLTAYAGERVTVDGSALAAGSPLAEIRGDHWTVRGLTFRNSPAQGFVAVSSAGGVFDRLVTADNGDSGFTLRGDGTTDNLVRNLDSHDNYDAAGHGRNADGIAVKFGSGTGNTITGARLYDNADDGLDLWQFSSPVTVEHSWAFGNGRNRRHDPAFEGGGAGFELGGGGASAAHVVDSNAAWENTLHGFSGSTGTGAVLLDRNTAYANKGRGFSFGTGPARLTRNLAAGNGTGRAALGPSTVSAGNGWDGGVTTPAFRSTTAATAYGPRRTDGSLPATTFLTTGSTAVGATMR